MKKLVVLGLALIMLISACSSSDDSETAGEGAETNSEKPSTEDTESSNENDDTSNTGETEQNEETEQDQDKNTEEEAPEEVDPLYEVSQKTWHIRPIDEDTNEKVVLLTIDDAPDGHALEMAQTLKELDANAIFFVNGHFLETKEEKEIVKQIYDMGFLIGNHTYSHKSLPDLDKETQREEILSVSDMVEDITGERPAFFRAPFGQNTDYSKQLAEEEGMVLMNWVYGYDWNKEYMSKDAITDIMVNTEMLGNGATLLMHDRDWTNAALHDIVVGLRDKDYEMVDPDLIKTIQ